MDTLTPIDEEPAEDNEEDQPITMIPKIMRTAPSPTSEQPPANASIQNETNAIRETKLHEIPISASKSDNCKSTPIPTVTINNGGAIENEMKQIESVL